MLGVHIFRRSFCFSCGIVFEMGPFEAGSSPFGRETRRPAVNVDCCRPSQPGCDPLLVWGFGVKPSFWSREGLVI